MQQLRDGCPERSLEEPTRLQEEPPLTGAEKADLMED